MLSINTLRQSASVILENLSAAIDPNTPSNKPKKKILAEHFEHPDGNVLTLSVPYEHLGAGEVKIGRSDTKLLIDIVPEFSDGLVSHPLTLRESRLSKEQLKTRFEEYGHLRLSKSSSAELSAFFRDLILKSRLEGHESGLWEYRAASFFTVLMEALVSLRDSGEAPLTGEQIRRHMPLDALVLLAYSEKLNPAAQSKLKTYLHDLPGFSEEDAFSNTLSQKCYELHGYITMQFTEELYSLIHSEEAKLRTTRPEPEHFEYTIKAPFKKVEAKITPHGVEVSVVFHPKDESYLI
jgi:hypothetical protein